MQSLPPAPDSGTVGEGLFSKKGNRFAASPIRSERVPIGAIQSLITTNKGGGGHVEFSSSSLYAIMRLAGTTPRGLSIFRNGNAMCEN